MGSAFEGTVTPDVPHDLDIMFCQEMFSVIEDIAKADKNKFSLLIVREPETPAGYMKLQLVETNKSLTSADWPVSRNYTTRFNCQKEKSEQAYIKALYSAKISTFRFAHTASIESIVAYHYNQTNDVTSYKFINFLWLLIHRIQNISTIFEHTAHEVKSAQALLLPCIYTCLASTISAFAFKITQFDIRDILLLGSLSNLFLNGDLSGRLKLISILLAAELYADCEWHLDQLIEEDIKCIPSVCVCRHCPTDSYFLPQSIVILPQCLPVFHFYQQNFQLSQTP
ncbi:unnamed protein product [Mytilus edulis]|uniref:Uncharacterized protein n=1 Tax=Mytilus edulis TaxID=6550 RepID=A0A8S3Q5W5_MYTED|nr:unnamed protein product [Mytilus edulis]